MKNIKLLFALTIITLCLIPFAYARNGGTVSIEGYEIEKVRILEFDEIPEPSVSPSGKSRVYSDSSDHALKKSENGGAYEDIGGSGSGAWTQTDNGAYLDGDATLTGSLSVNEHLTVEGSANIDGGTFYVDSVNNRVGIGTTSPHENLQVGLYTIVANPANAKYLAMASNVYYDSPNWKYISNDQACMLLLDGSAGTQYYRVAETGNADDTISWTTAMFIANNSNIGFGGETSPDANLEVVDDFMVSSAAGNDGDLFIVNNAGDVGIGATSPTTKVEISGDLSAGDSLTISKGGLYINGEITSNNDGSVNEADDPISWFQLADVPAGFADGTDDGGAGGGSGIFKDETTYYDLTTSKDIWLDDDLSVEGDLTVRGAIWSNTTQWDNGSNKIDGEQIADDTIDNDSIDWADMVDLDTDGAVSWGNIAEGELADSTVVSADIKDGEITTTDCAFDPIEETEMDSFSEAQSQIADKTLVNEEDAVTFDNNIVMAKDLSVADNLTAFSIQWTQDIRTITVLSPSDVNGNGMEPIVYTNETGQTMYVVQIKGWAKGYDDTVVTIKETDADGTSNETTVEAITCTTGSDPYTVTVERADIDARTIEDGHCIHLEHDGTDDPTSVTVMLKLRPYDG